MRYKVFLPFSTYHILLSYAIASDDTDNIHIMIVGDSSPRMKEMIYIFEKIFPKVFSHVYFLESTYKLTNLKAHLLKKKNIQTINEIINSLGEISDFYYSCEWNVYTTFTSHLLKTSELTCPKYHFIEDGIATYVETSLKTKCLPERIADYIFYGHWHRSCRIHGGLNQDAVVNAIFPDLLPYTYNSHLKEKINYENLLSNLKLDLLPDNIKPVINNIPKINLLIALDSIGSYQMSTYSLLIKKNIHSALQSGLTVAIKRHPADTDNPDVLKIFDLPNEVIDLPSYLPVEFYYLYFHNSLQKIIGGLSTSMMTAQWLIPQAHVISTFYRSEINKTPNAAAIFDIFKKIGIAVELI